MTALTDACVITIKSFSSEHPETLIWKFTPERQRPFLTAISMLYVLVIKNLYGVEIPRIEGKSIAKLLPNVVRSVNRTESQPFLCRLSVHAKNYDTDLRRKHESDS